jgi:hypothetical protein
MILPAILKVKNREEKLGSATLPSFSSNFFKDAMIGLSIE